MSVIKNFMWDAMKTIVEDEISATENDAVGFRTTGNPLLDLNFSTASLRRWSQDEIVRLFAQAFQEDWKLAMRWLFFCRDCRGGMGERRTFRAVIEWLAIYHPNVMRAVLPLVDEYGRGDDLLCLLDTGLMDAVIAHYTAQIEDDVRRMNEGEGISLCAKWMPSCNASSEEARRYGHVLRKGMGMTEARYRKTLTMLRAYLEVAETKMSNGTWGEIDYESVPSRAALIYRKAFLRHDQERRQAYLDKLTKGEAKINASVSFPHDIVHAYRYRKTQHSVCDSNDNILGYTAALEIMSEDPTLEGAWKALPDYVNGRGGRTICVVDGSGSMTCPIGNSEVMALEVANALGLYFAERLTGPFKDRFITFSSRPQLVDVSKAKTLHDRLEICYAHDECSNTNIEATFDLILETAVRHGLKQDELPSNVLVLSDMEFDCACGYVGGYCRMDRYGADRNALFTVIRRNFEVRGYKLPRLVFWNLNSRTRTIPVKKNKLGASLVSGFSPAIAKMVLSGKLDPFECLKEQLYGPRYDAVGKALEECAA